ncbi:hypothetical protein ETB97_007896 [Aspergillus alliaceus]|uniref:Protein-tyrosine-phosphatase n=1 Tax=Petromyces alliaceus TaxID=209559 RepID=A0A8H6ACP6_PETAA|nr:hypothetical protein ETB97_007896 [Aspergillus burnettii]
MQARKAANSLTPSISEIEPGLFIGNAGSSHDLKTLRDNGISAIVSLESVRSCYWASKAYREIIPEERHLFIACVDTSVQDLLQHMSDACDFIDRMLASVQPHLSSTTSESSENVEHTQRGGILVHCGKGISRSGTIVVAYLMRKHQMSLNDVLKLVQEKRKVKPSVAFMEQLDIWEKVKYEVWEDAEKMAAKPPYQEYLDKRKELISSRLNGPWPYYIDLAFGG